MNTIDINDKYSVNYVLLNDVFCFFYAKHCFREETKSFIDYYIRTYKPNNIRFIQYKERSINSFEEFVDWRNDLQKTISYKKYAVKKYFDVDFLDIIENLFFNCTKEAVLEYSIVNNADKIESLLLKNKNNIDDIRLFLERNTKLVEVVRDNHFEAFKKIHEITNLNLEVNDSSYMKVALINNRLNFLNYLIKNNFDFKKVVLSEDIFSALNNVNKEVFDTLLSYENFIEFFFDQKEDAKIELKDYYKIKNYINLKRF